MQCNMVMHRNTFFFLKLFGFYLNNDSMYAFKNQGIYELSSLTPYGTCQSSPLKMFHHLGLDFVDILTFESDFHQQPLKICSICLAILSSTVFFDKKNDKKIGVFMYFNSEMSFNGLDLGCDFLCFLKLPHCHNT